MPSHKRSKFPQLIRNVVIFALLIFSIYKVSLTIKSAYSEKANLFDFRAIYLASTAWLQGYNPYDHGILSELWGEKGGSPDQLPNFNLTPSIYPITAYVILSPIGFYKWQQAKNIFTTINLLSFIPMYFALLFLIKGHFFEWQAILLMTFCLALWPLSISIELGQPTLLAASFLIVSLYISTLETRHDYLCGVLLALSLSLKPQIGILFLIYFAFSRRWTIIISSFTAMIIIIFMGILRLNPHNLSWIYGFWGNLQIAFGPNGVNDPVISNNYAIYLVNLHYLLHNLINDRFLSNAIIIIVALIMTLIFVKYVKTNSINYYDNLLNFSVLAVISLVTFYHRQQDAIILMIPLSLIVVLFTLRYYKYALILLIVVSPFMSSFMFIVACKSKEYYLKYGDSISWFKKLVLLCCASYQSLSLFILSVILIYLMTTMNDNAA